MRGDGTKMTLGENTGEQYPPSGHCCFIERFFFAGSQYLSWKFGSHVESFGSSLQAGQTGSGMVPFADDFERWAMSHWGIGWKGIFKGDKNPLVLVSPIGPGGEGG